MYTHKLSIVRTLVASLTSVFLIFLGTMPVQAAAATATLKLSPSSTSVTVGSEVTLTVLTDSPQNVVAGTIVTIVVPSRLQYVSADFTGSILSQEVRAPSVSGGNLSFERLDLAPSFKGSNGKIATLTFKALSVGSAALTITKASSEIDAYEDASNVLNTVQNATINVVAVPTPTPTPVAATPTPTPTAVTSGGTTTTKATPTPTPNKTKATPTPTSKPATSGGTSPTPTPSSGGTSATPSPTAASAETPDPAESPSPTPVSATASTDLGTEQFNNGPSKTSPVAYGLFAAGAAVLFFVLYRLALFIQFRRNTLK